MALTRIDGSLITGTISSASEFVSGTLMLFQQTSSPTGWTKQTTHNDKALRVVSGSASSGGSVAFTSAFASQAVNGTVGTSGSTTLSSAQIPSHTHTTNFTSSNFCGSSTGLFSAGGGAIPLTSDNGTGGGGSHTHSGGSFTGTAINLAVQYVDLIIASKD